MSNRDLSSAEKVGEIDIPEQLIFATPEDATGEDVLRMIRIGRELGFDYQGENPLALKPVPQIDPKEEMARHIDSTYPPTDTSSFMAREHFGVAAVELDFRKGEGSRLFTDLVFPVVGLRGGGQYRTKVKDAKALSHEEAGLEIVEREQAGMDPTPVPLSRGRYPSLRESFYLKTRPDASDLDEVAIRVGSLIEFGHDESRVKSICTARSQLVLKALTTHLEDLLG